LKLIVKIAT